MPYLNKIRRPARQHTAQAPLFSAHTITLRLQNSYFPSSFSPAFSSSFFPLTTTSSKASCLPTQPPAFFPHGTTSQRHQPLLTSIILFLNKLTGHLTHPIPPPRGQDERSAGTTVSSFFPSFLSSSSCFSSFLPSSSGFPAPPPHQSPFTSATTHLPRKTISLTDNPSDAAPPRWSSSGTWWCPTLSTCSHAFEERRATRPIGLSLVSFPASSSSSHFSITI